MCRRFFSQQGTPTMSGRQKYLFSANFHTAEPADTEDSLLNILAVFF